MARKKKITKIQKISKLPRGYKICQGCNEKLHIHKIICPNCNYQNKIKKKIVSVKSIIENNTPKSLLALLQSNELNKMILQKQNSQNTTINSLYKIFDEEFSQIKQTKQIKVENTIKKIPKYNLKELSKQLKIFMTNKPIKCVRFSVNLLAFSEQQYSQIQDIHQNDIITIKAFKLQNYHKIGHKYRGISYIYISQFPFSKINYRLKIQKNIIQLEWYKNLLAILCGDGSILIQNIPIKIQLANISNIKTLIMQNQCIIEEKNFSTLEWIKSRDNPLLLCGDYNGNINIFQIKLNSNKYICNCLRYIPNAHNAFITTIKECPINDKHCQLFATGSYDGCIKIWNLNELMPIYQQEVTNVINRIMKRKIISIMWDSGGKFIMIQRDDNFEGCILLSLFSTNKQNSKLILLNETQIRYLKEFNEFNLNSMDHDSNYCVIGSRNGKIEVCDVQSMRKLSIKKNKSKINDLIQKHLQIKKLQNNLISISTKKQSKEEKTQNFLNFSQDFSMINSDIHHKVINKSNFIGVGSYLGFLLIYQMS